ncbi:hypothetical protein F5Y17DRAFT_439667 [Xylariaceae sp. FL0594]|nr:hypothetical protein F5Y17DRAFT_439667 [Xylariaceae sp. FL0594]
MFATPVHSFSKYPLAAQNMSNAATNGEYDASSSSCVLSSTRREDLRLGGSHKAAQSLRTAANSGDDISASSDLALSLDLPENQTPSLSRNSNDDDDDNHLLDYGPSEASYYWDASTMAPLSAVSAAAIARLRAYKPPPFPIWDRLPLSRRAAVLILLFADRRGDLRVVITMRAASLRNFSGHAAFPGGKADSLSETPYQIARREAWEEIGLPMDDNKLPSPFRIEPLCSLPCSLAKTELVVRPCVAFLHADRKTSSSKKVDYEVTADEAMIPRLDAKEVAAVFSAPFANFLRRADEEPREGDPPLPPGHWYDGRWINWQSDPWRVHNFHVPVHNQRVSKPRKVNRVLNKQPPAEELLEKKKYSSSSSSVDSPHNAHNGDEKEQEEQEEEKESIQRFLVWGMTGRILVDAARIAYAKEPEFEHNAHFGDEALIADLEDGGRGRLAKEKEKEKRGDDDNNGVDAKM